MGSQKLQACRVGNRTYGKFDGEYVFSILADYQYQDLPRAES